MQRDLPPWLLRAIRKRATSAATKTRLAEHNRGLAERPERPPVATPVAPIAPVTMPPDILEALGRALARVDPAALPEPSPIPPIASHVTPPVQVLHSPQPIQKEARSGELPHPDGLLSDP